MEYIYNDLKFINFHKINTIVLSNLKKFTFWFMEFKLIELTDFCRCHIIFISKLKLFYSIFLIPIILTNSMTLITHDVLK